MTFYTERQERQKTACGQMQKGIRRSEAKGKRIDKQEIQLKNTRKNLREGK